MGEEIRVNRRGNVGKVAHEINVALDHRRYRVITAIAVTVAVIIRIRIIRPRLGLVKIGLDLARRQQTDGDKYADGYVFFEIFHGLH